MKRFHIRKHARRLACVAVSFFNLATCPAVAQYQTATTTTRSSDDRSYLTQPYVMWAGPYIGGFVGGNWADFGNNGAPGPSGTDLNIMGGGDVGYNWQRSRLVLGAETDFSKIDNSSGSGNIKYIEDWAMSFRGRAGYAMGSLLPYATAGLGLTHSVAKLSGIGSDTNLQPGVAAGAGVDAMVAPNWFARIEYLYTDVPKDSTNIAGTTITGGSGNHALRVGLNYKF